MIPGKTYPDEAEERDEALYIPESGKALGVGRAFAKSVVSAGNKELFWLNEAPSRVERVCPHLPRAWALTSTRRVSEREDQQQREGRKERQGRAGSGKEERLFSRGLPPWFTLRAAMRARARRSGPTVAGAPPSPRLRPPVPAKQQRQVSRSPPPRLSLREGGRGYGEHSSAGASGCS